ncbi:AsmA-like C-terminal region-containing protein [Roseivirga sp. E12]|uniref:AsmA family protein n=1 Tax=Roseivirga sp. E12 TaxID=2819237 RepID=UPI001ABC0432|nr:AsmA-like C-terminal region-containing protein [Roseivirga sp. E12]MBO3697011.1 AsmA family protein [Roseivirga sp. E12]
MKTTHKFRRWIKILMIIGLSLIFLVTIVIGIVYNQQDKLIQKALSSLNKDFTGQFSVEDSHISPFVNFPYVSIDLENVAIYETKSDSTEALVGVQDVYVGFDLLSIVKGDYQVKKVKLSDGFIKLIQHTDGSLNVLNALSNDQVVEEKAPSAEGAPLNLSLEAVELKNIDLLKINEANNILAEVFIEKISSSLSMSEEHIKAKFDSRVLFNLVLDGDTSFLHDKHLSLSTGIDYDLKTGILDLDPSELFIEKASFLMDGHINVEDSLNLDLQISGQKPNFDLFLAFIPEEYNPLIQRYANGGKVYFDADIKGPAAFGKTPHLEIDFGCEEAFIENLEAGKEVNDLFFKGHFTTGAQNSPETMLLTIQDFTAKPETGTFRGDVRIENFDSPDIEMKVNSEFNLDFLAEFFNIQGLEDVSGKIALDMNFHDIIDLDDPSKAIERLNESYYTELKVEDLNFKSPNFHLPLQDINIHASMDGHRAEIDQFELKAGNSNISFSADISDLPAIIHHTSLPVDVNMDIQSNMIDLLEITKIDSLTEGFDEQIRDLSLGFKFKSSAKAFTESPYLPLGEFFITRLKADLTHYPHQLHDFNADIIIDSTDFKVIDFTGMLDQSDFHFDGNLTHYDLWFQDQPRGTSEIDFNLDAQRIQLEDLFSYGGENYVPEDYRHEEFRNLRFHGLSKLEFDKEITAVGLELDHLSTSMKVHGMKLENFAGKIWADSSKLLIENLGGKVGNSEFVTDLTYYLKQDETSPNHSFSFKSPKLDFDQLFSYVPAQIDTQNGQVDHEAGFNVFDLPFANMDFSFDIDEMNYHKYLLDDFMLEGKMQRDHYIYLDTMSLKAAGGEMRLSGYFNGSDPKQIYFSPNMELKDVDLDKLLFKFDNFGQDQLVSNNLHGQLSGSLKGKIHMHPDLVPATDVSELEMDIEVLDGSLVDFTPFEALSSYFTDKNLNLVRFDTLQNKLTLSNGDLIIPNMNINTSLGYFEISGTQSLDLNMDYVMRIPFKVVTRAGFRKLFGRKNRDNSDQVDDIQYRDESKRTTFVSVRVKGTPEDYDVTLGRKKEKN